MAARAPPGADSTDWTLLLDPQQADLAPAAISCASSKLGDVIELFDVLFGDVFLCGGQSNMALNLRVAFEGEKYIDEADRRGQAPTDWVTFTRTHCSHTRAAWGCRGRGRGHQRVAGSPTRRRYPHLRVFTVGQKTGVPGIGRPLPQLSTFDQPWARSLVTRVFVMHLPVLSLQLQLCPAAAVTSRVRFPFPCPLRSPSAAPSPWEGPTGRTSARCAGWPQCSCRTSWCDGRDMQSLDNHLQYSVIAQECKT